MKKLFLVALVAISSIFGVAAQRVAVVDITQVLNALPEYKRAQEDLDKIAQKWRNEIAQEQDIIKGMYNRLQAEQVMLSEEQRRSREEEIMNKEKVVREMQRTKFGPEGELFRKRQELVKPIQDKVYAAIERFSTERGYDLVLDKAGSAGIIFAAPALDRTQQVIDLVKKM